MKKKGEEEKERGDRILCRAPRPILGGLHFPIPVF